MNNAQGRDVTLTLVYFVGEYNNKPGKPSMAPGLEPFYSNDGIHWQPVEQMDWDETKTEATLHLRPAGDTIWLAHIPPYTPSNLKHLLEDVDRSPHARVEVIGQSVGGRNLVLVTVTDAKTPDANKKTVWLMARQHAWEAGTSWIMEGALRCMTGDSAEVQALREKVVFKFSPMVDVDGCLAGHVRFNPNGYDVNRHWDEVDLRSKESLRLMPEIWYHKKAILAQMAQHDGKGIDLMINLHNTETAEFMQTQVNNSATYAFLKHFDERLGKNSLYDPSAKLAVSNSPANTTNCLWLEAKVPVCLIEERTGRSKKLGHRPMIEDRLTFGGQLIKTMGATVSESAAP